jgi:hypothetical protein
MRRQELTMARNAPNPAMPETPEHLPSVVRRIKRSLIARMSHQTLALFA